MATRAPNPLTWFFEPLERDPSYRLKLMFGCDAAYFGGLLCLVAADRDEPWNGMLVCTSQERQSALIAELPALRPHPVLGKWLYVSQHHPAFETIAEQLVALVLARDGRIGVAPKPRRVKARSGTAKA